MLMNELEKSVALGAGTVNEVEVSLISKTVLLL